MWYGVRVYRSKAKDNNGENYGNRSACGDGGAAWGQDRDQHAGTHSGKTSDSHCHDGRQRIGRAASCHRSAHSIYLDANGFLKTLPVKKSGKGKVTSSQTRSLQKISRMSFNWMQRTNFN